MPASQFARTASETRTTDAQLRASVQEGLRAHGGVDVTKIGISVSAGDVLLWGSVATPSERQIAGEVAVRLAGAACVENRIRVFQH